MKSNWKTLIVAGMPAIAALCGTMQPAQAQARVTSAVLARQYVNGKAQGVTTTFKPSDRVIHCVVKLSRAVKAQMRFTWIAVDAAGMKNYKVLDKTMPNQLIDTAHFSASLPRDWPMGKYRADVYLNGKMVRSLPARVQ